MPRGRGFQRKQQAGHGGEMRVRNLVNASRFVAVPYGRSDDTPYRDGEEFDRFFERHREIEQLKRPDFLVFRRDVFARRFPLLDPECLTLAEESDMEVAEFLDAACAAIEVKYSASANATRFTIKEEEIHDLIDWQRTTGRDLLVAQVVPDRVGVIPIQDVAAIVADPANAGMLVRWENINKPVWMIPLELGWTLVNEEDNP